MTVRRTLFLIIAVSLATIPVARGAEPDGYRSLPFKTLDNQTITIGDLKGKPVLLEFWASWCPPCRASLPYINKLYSRIKGQAHIIGVNVDMTDAERLHRVSDELGILFPVWLNNEAIRPEFDGVSAIPVFVILDSNGTFVKKITGLKKDLDVELEKELRPLMKK